MAGIGGQGEELGYLVTRQSISNVINFSRDMGGSNNKTPQHGAESKFPEQFCHQVTPRSSLINCSDRGLVITIEQNMLLGPGVAPNRSC